MRVQHFRAAEVEVVPPRREIETRVAVLLNANARKVTPKAIRSLAHAVADGDLYVSRSQLDAHRIAQQVVARRYSTVFLGGGDGTVACFINEISNALASSSAPARLPRFGILRMGTGNSVASVVNASEVRGDGIVDDVLRARSGDVPSIKTVDFLQVEGKRAPFAGLGVDGRILNDYVWVKENLAQGPFSRFMTGAGGYLASVALRTLPHYLTHETRVDCEVTNGDAGVAYRVGSDGRPAGDPIPQGGLIHRGPLTLAAAGTLPFYGYEFRMFPFAGRRRGMMHLRLSDLKAPEVLGNLGELWRGAFGCEGVFDFLTRDATVRCASPMPLQVAGDAAGDRRELRFQVSPDPISLLDFTGDLH
jgi:diacylglycerol kinase family enzyme